MDDLDEMLNGCEVVDPVIEVSIAECSDTKAKQFFKLKLSEWARFYQDGIGAEDEDVLYKRFFPHIAVSNMAGLELDTDFPVEAYLDMKGVLLGSEDYNVIMQKVLNCMTVCSTIRTSS